MLSITQKAPVNVDVSYIEVPTKDDYFKVFPGRLVFKEIFLVSAALSRTFHIGFNYTIGAIHCVLPMVIHVLKDYLYNELTIEQFRAKYSDPKIWVYSVFLGYTNYMTFQMNTKFSRLALMDMKRKLFKMKALEVIIEPNR